MLPAIAYATCQWKIQNIRTSLNFLDADVGTECNPEFMIAQVLVCLQDHFFNQYDLT